MSAAEASTAELSSHSVDSGLLSLAVLARLQGKPAQPEQLRHELGLKGPASADDLLRAAKRLDLKAKKGPLDVKRLDAGTAPLPCIVERRAGGFAVLARFEQGKGLIHDPFEGRPRTLSAEELGAELSGRAVFVVSRGCWQESSRALTSPGSSRLWIGSRIWLLVLLSLMLFASDSRTQEYRSSNKDKADVLAFLKRFVNAVEQDAFLEPERLKSVLGVEVQEWTGENVQPFHRIAQRVVTNVPVIDTTDIAKHLRYSIVPRDHRYTFGIDRMAHVICVKPPEVVSVIGEPNVQYGRTLGRKNGGFGVGYSFTSTSFQSKVAAFHYATDGDLTCLDAILVNPTPAKR